MMNRQLLKITILLIAIACCIGCNRKRIYKPDKKVEATFEQTFKYARQVKWEKEDDMEIASFKEYNYKTNAWFTRKGEWLMTVIALDKRNPPTDIAVGVKKTIYAAWDIEEIDLVIRFDQDSIYVVSITHNDDELLLYMNTLGTILLDNKDNRNDDIRNYPIPPKVESYIFDGYPNSKVIDVNRENKNWQIILIDAGMIRHLLFDVKYEWVSTSWEVDYITVPQIVKDAFRRAGYNVNDNPEVYYYSSIEGVYYHFVIEKDNQNLYLNIKEDGASL